MSLATPNKRSQQAGRFGNFTPDDLAILAEKAPEAYRELMADSRNTRRRAWANLIAQLIGNVSALTALIILGSISWHAIDRGAATQAASMICTGAASIVAVFVTGRLTSSRSTPNQGGNPETLQVHGRKNGA